MSEVTRKVKGGLLVGDIQNVKAEVEVKSSTEAVSEKPKRVRKPKEETTEE